MTNNFLLILTSWTHRLMFPAGMQPHRKAQPAVYISHIRLKSLVNAITNTDTASRCSRPLTLHHVCRLANMHNWVVCSFLLSVCRYWDILLVWPYQFTSRVTPVCDWSRVSVIHVYSSLFAFELCWKNEMQTGFVINRSKNLRKVSYRP